MALFQGTVYSEALRMQTRLTVYLPGDRNRQISEQKTMYLLHGLSDAGDAWVMNTSVCRYAQEKNIAVIMPEGHRSFYADIPFGSAYFTYITQELPELCQKMFTINTDPMCTMIAGNSMGGYGALKSYFSNPMRYQGGCFAFSPVISIEDLDAVLPDGKIAFDIRSMGGKDFTAQPQNDLFSLSVKLPKTLPGIYITCGTQDFLYSRNTNFHNYLIMNAVDHSFISQPGIHGWTFWDSALCDAFKRIAD